VPPAAAHLAYVDEPIRIPHGQVTIQPSLIARMVQALRLAGSERVLEVGTGLGFQAAILAMLAREVVSVERFADLAEQARANLEAAGSATSGWWLVTAPSACSGTPRTTRSSSRRRRRTSLSPSSSNSLPAGGWCTRSARVAANW
jgi:Protein-L-isoaspartate(D-aspartate) O-methyltransferase (PCMT)